MFITVVSSDSCLLAEVECRENQVSIRTEDNRLRMALEEIYRQDMSMVEFARANYLLNRWRSIGLSWELVLASEYQRRVG